jgi:glycosyltransferase involved in cell wall biosynthesis
MLGGELAGLPDIGYGAALGLGGRWSAEAGLRFAQLITVGSLQLYRRAAVAAPSTPVRLLPLGVGPEWFEVGRPTPEPDGAPGGPSRSVLSVGALTPVKDPVTTMRAFARVAHERPSIHLDVVGDGPLRGPCQRLAATLGMSDRVTFRGSVPRSQLPARYADAAVFLASSRHESQAMVVVEAAARGCPVVATDVGVVPELVRAGGAVGVRPGDVAGLARALATVLDDERLRSRMGADGFRHAQRAWRLETAVERLDDAYQGLARRVGR